MVTTVVENPEVTEALECLLDSFQDSLEGAKDKAMSQYKGGKILPVKRKEAGQEYWFRAQIVILGKANRYWVNLNGFRDWVRFRIDSREQLLELVIVGHTVRDPNKGVIVAYIEKRQSHQAADKLHPFQVIEPFWVEAGEQEEDQEKRFREWKRKAAEVAISYWEKDVPLIPDERLDFEDDKPESDGDLDEYLVSVAG